MAIADKYGIPVVEDAAVGGAAGVIHMVDSATTDCQPNENVEGELFKVGFCLPAGPYVTDEGVRYIVDSIKEAIV